MNRIVGTPMYKKITIRSAMRKLNELTATPTRLPAADEVRHPPVSAASSSDLTAFCGQRGRCPVRDPANGQSLNDQGASLLLDYW